MDLSYSEANFGFSAVSSRPQYAPDLTTPVKGFTNTPLVGSSNSALRDFLLKHLEFLINIPALPRDSFQYKVVKLNSSEDLIS